MITTDEMLNIINAYKNCNVINVTDALHNHVMKLHVEDNPNYRFDFEHERYEIYGKPEYIPYETPEEFLGDARKYGSICYKRNKEAIVRVHVSANGRCCIPGEREYTKDDWDGKTFAFIDLLYEYMFVNGRPCGKIKSE